MCYIISHSVLPKVSVKLIHKFQKIGALLLASQNHSHAWFDVCPWVAINSKAEKAKDESIHNRSSTSPAKSRHLSLDEKSLRYESLLILRAIQEIKVFFLQAEVSFSKNA